MARSKAGIYVEDVEQVVQKTTVLQSQTEKFSDSLSAFVQEVNELQDLGQNIAKIMPLLDSIQSDLRVMTEQSRDTINLMKGHLVETMETESTNISLE